MRASRPGIAGRLPLALTFALFSGCAAATLDVVSPVPVPATAVVLTIRDATLSGTSKEQLASLHRAVVAELRDAGITVVSRSSNPAAARLVGRVERYHPGLRALRFVSRYGLGTGHLDTVWELRDRRSAALAACRIEGSVSMGTFGGSFADVEQDTGRALARFLHGEIR